MFIGIKLSCNALFVWTTGFCKAALACLRDMLKVQFLRLMNVCILPQHSAFLCLKEALKRCIKYTALTKIALLLINRQKCLQLISAILERNVLIQVDCLFAFRADTLFCKSTCRFLLKKFYSLNLI